MSSDAIFAHGTLLKAGNGAATEVFTSISEVTEINGLSLELEALEATHHGSAGWRDFIGGLLSGGEVSLSINYKPTHATHNASTGLIKDMTSRTKRNFQMVFPDGSSTTWSFTALVTGFEPGAPVDDKLSASVTLTVTGVPTLV